MHGSRRFLSFLGAVFTLALSGVPAQAQPGHLPPAPAAPAPAPRVRTERYGLMLGAVDATGLVIAVTTDQRPLFIGSYLLAGPLVHVLHRNHGTALASIGLRSSLVLGGVLVGALFSDCYWAYVETSCTTDYMPEGAMIGAASALILDWVWLARTTTREEPEPPALLRAGSLRANPGVQTAQSGGLLLGLDGHF